MFLFAALLDATTHFGKAFCTLVLEEVYFSIQEMIVQIRVNWWKFVFYGFIIGLQVAHAEVTALVCLCV